MMRQIFGNLECSRSLFITAFLTFLKIYRIVCHEPIGFQRSKTPVIQDSRSDYPETTGYAAAAQDTYRPITNHYNAASAPYGPGSRYPYPTYAGQAGYTGNSYAYHQPTYYYPITSTASPTACKSSTYRTNLGCYCSLIGQRCFVDHSVCIDIGNNNNDGTCGCMTGYVAYNFRCITTAQYNNITNNGTTTSNFVISGPTIIASCFLPIGGVVGKIAGFNSSRTYTLTLLSSAPLGANTKYVDIDTSTGNFIYKVIAPTSLTNQVYSLVTQANGNTFNQTITIAYNCTGPTCSFDLGNSQIVDCLRYTIGDTVVRLLVNGSVSPTVFSMSMIDSSSQNGNTFFRIDSNTGQVILQKMPHGGAFVEHYSVSAVNGAQASCPAQTLTVNVNGI